MRDALYFRFATTGKGSISLSETCSGILSALSSAHGREAGVLYRRYYRSYIRAFNDAKDAAVARPGRPEDDNSVSRSSSLTHLLHLLAYPLTHSLD